MSINIETNFRENFNSSDVEDEQIINQKINNQLKQHFLNQQKKVLFIVNPASGCGRALNTFEKKVVPLLKQSQIKFEVVVTTKQGSAYKYLKNSDPEIFFKWSGIVVVSGDGLLFEVFNSLMKRKDWKRAIKIPVGIIPGGSGNGLSYSISHAVGDTKQNQILAATKNVISGKSSPLDLIRVTCDKKVYYAFLSIGWGLLSDIDIESESLRILGGHRFSIWAIIRALGLRKYSGKLKFKLFPGYSKVTKVNDEFRKSRPNSISSDIEFNESDQIKLINYITRKEENFFNKRNELFDNKELIKEIEHILNKNEDENDMKHPLNGKLNIHTQSPNDSLTSSRSSNTAGSNDGDDRNSIDDKHNDNNNNQTVSFIVDNGIQNGLIDSDYKRDETIDRTKNNENDWITIKGDFVMVYAVSTSHISSDCHFAPGAKLDDGIIWLLFLKGDIGRKEVFKFLLNLEKGNHVNLSFVHLVPVKEFVLESYSDSRITVDGELVNTNTVKCEMMQSLARIMTK